MWKLAPAGDRALLVTLGQRIDERTLAITLALDRALTASTLHGLEATIPSYASVLCRFDPEVLPISDLERLIRSLEPALQPVDLGGQLHEVPTVYDGPDLARVAEHAQLSPDKVIALHSSVGYLVYSIGFAPGFAYCGAVPQAIATPRLDSPRTSVPAGSVGIAGRQTGIYAVSSPGGWNLIGRTDLVLFDPQRTPPIPFQPGDRVRFRPQ
jgi:KipI family sensor histidine kinase inhibitor